MGIVLACGYLLYDVFVRQKRWERLGEGDFLTKDKYIDEHNN
jgi:hypothetical protein